MKHELFTEKITSKLKSKLGKLPGFTIVELMVVIVVLAILATLVIISYDTVTRDSESSAVQTDLRHAYAKLKMYRLDNGEYPSVYSGDVALSSPNTEFSYVFGGGARFCLNGQSTKGEDILFHITQSEEIGEGECGPMVGTSENCFKYRLNTGPIAIIEDYYDTESNVLGGTQCPRDVVIPDLLNGTAVSHMDPEAFRDKGLTSVVFPRSITKIEYYAFAENSLSHVHLPQSGSLTTISSSAFRSQNNTLKKVVIPETVTAVGESSFSGNPGIICHVQDGKNYGLLTGCSQILYSN